MADLSGRVALITGAGRGQGRAHALAFARAGADIAICDACKPWNTPYDMPTEEDLAGVVAEVEALGRRCIGVRADVTSSADVQRFVGETIEAFGRIDFVLANAGILGVGGKLWELSEELFDETIAVDLKGVWLTCRYAIPHLLERGGAVVLTSSMAGQVGYQNIGAYVAAKHGVLGLMKTLANEAAPHNVRVNALMPGTCDTPMTFNQAQYDLFSPEEPTKEATLRIAETLFPLPGSTTEPEDQAAAALWLCSDEARFVTGIALPVAGGQS